MSEVESLPPNSAAEVASEPSPSLRGRFAKTGGSFIVQMICFQGTTFVANIILARWFGPSGFGLYGAGLQTLNSASQTAQLATAAVGSRHLGYWYDHDRTRALRTWHHCQRVGLRSGVIFSLVSIAIAPWLATTVFKLPAATSGLMVAGLGVFFVVASQQLLLAFTTIERLRTTIIGSIATGIVFLVATLTGGRLFGAMGALAGTVISYVFLFLFLLAPAREAFRTTETETPLNAEEKQELVGQLRPAAISGLMLLPSTWILLALVANGRGAAEAGTFAAVTQIRLLLMTVPQVANSVGLVLVNRFAQSENRGRTKMISAAMLLGSSAVTSIIGFLAASFLPKVFGHKYAAGIPILKILCWSVFLESAVLLVRQRLQIEAEYNEWLYYVTIPWQASTFLLAYLLVPHLGAQGAAIAYISGLAIGLVTFALRRSVKRRFITQANG